VDPLAQVKQVMTLEDLVRFQDQIRRIHVEPPIREYIIRIVASSRNHKDFILGAGPRATKGLYRAAQAMAAVSGRDFVLPDDVKQLYPSIIYHRVILSAEGRLNRHSVDEAVNKAVNMVPAPLLHPESALQVER